LHDSKLIEIGYFLSRRGKDAPPPELKVKSWKDAYLCFYEKLNNGMTKENFINNLKNFRDHFDSYIDNNRVGWLDKDGKPDRLPERYQAIYNILSKISDQELWEYIKPYASIDSNSFSWEFDVNTFKLIGSELISDKFTAIIELVKNSYDANATEVKIEFINSHSLDNGKIILSDNGMGMSKEDISGKWMRIGTNSKRVRQYSPEPFKRVLLGEKGIGRFAIEKIANHIILETKEKDISSIHHLEIDWRKYEESRNLDKPPLFTSIKNKYEELDRFSYDKNISHGTILIFEYLKETWSHTDIARLKRELAKLISPIDTKYQKYEFKIFVKESDGKKPIFEVEEYQEIRNTSLDYASTVYEIDFEIKGSQILQKELHFNEEMGMIEIIYSKAHSFGPIKMKLYYFNKDDKRKFKTAYKNKDVAIDGFKIYRDGVLATPFVEIASTEEGVDKYRDILGIDKRRWSNFFGKISSHDFIGFIEISKEYNPGIKDLTNRQDFEDTTEYKEFKTFIISQLQQIEKLLEEEKKKERKEKENQLDEALNEVNEVKKSLKNLTKITPEIENTVKPVFSVLQTIAKTIRESSKEIKDLKSDLEKQEEVYFSLMSLQEYAADLAHMVRNSLDKIIGFSEYLKDVLADTDLHEEAKLMYYEMLKLTEDVNYMLKYAQSGDELKEFDVGLLILKVFSAHAKRFEENNISIEVPKPDSLRIKHNETLLRDAIQNLISNSIKALSKSNADKKIIKCNAYREDSKYYIIFSDNGTGISNNIKDKIFDRYFTTSKNEGGSGLGLYVVKNNLKTFKGTIELIDSEFVDKGCTFKITIPIKEGE